MTIASETARQRHNGNGATTSFTTGFAFRSNSEVRVIHTDAAGTDTEWTENTQYTLTGAGTGSAGTVTIDTAPTDYTPATGEHITIIRDVSFTQTLDGDVLSTMSAEDQEDAFDHVWEGMGQLKEMLSRALISPETGDGGEPATASWIPTLAVATDGTRRVLQITGWTGGTGTEPDAGYVGTGGIVAAIADAADIRGPAGTAGAGTGDMLAANNLSDVLSAATAFANIKQAASTTATGVVEIATDAEAQAGVDTGRAITPANLQAVTATETRKGVLELATTAEAAAGVDTARGVTPAGAAAAIAALAQNFPTGTAMLFVQTAAPTGWTKSTTHNNKALRIVSGSVSSGGSVDFSTLFARTGTDAVTLIQANLPAINLSFDYSIPTSALADGATNAFIPDLTGTGLTKTVPLGGSGSSFTPAIDMRVKYVDVILATKN